MWPATVAARREIPHLSFEPGIRLAVISRRAEATPVTTGRAAANVPGKAFPGVEARRRAVEGHTKARVPACDVNRTPKRDLQSPSKQSPRRLGKATNPGSRAERWFAEMEVIL